jgi:hypothetical protein
MPLDSIVKLDMIFPRPFLTIHLAFFSGALYACYCWFTRCILFLNLDHPRGILSVPFNRCPWKQ